MKANMPGERPLARIRSPRLTKLDIFGFTARCCEAATHIVEASK